MFVPGLLRQKRTEKSLSQDELATAAGVHRTTVLKIENGQQRPRPRTLRKLASALGIKPIDLLQSG